MRIGGSILLERAHLNRRRVRTQQRTFCEIEGVVHVHRRVVGRKVERSEVVPLRLALGPERDGESELAEDRDDFVDDERDRMLAAAASAVRAKAS